MDWGEGHAAGMEEECTRRVGRKSSRKETTWMSKGYMGENIDIDVKHDERVNWIYLAEDRDMWCALFEHSNETSGYRKI